MFIEWPGVLAVLDNKAKPIKHGYVMLKNRGQKDVDSGMTLAEARAAEMDYFDGSKYKGENRHLGAGVLTSRLTKLLVSQIRSSLPDMMIEIHSELKKAEAELRGLGSRPAETYRERLVLINDILREWGRELSELTQQQQIESDDRPHVLQLENCARKKFVDDMYSTMPGFGGEQDTYKVEWSHQTVETVEVNKRELDVDQASVLKFNEIVNQWKEQVAPPNKEKSQRLCIAFGVT